MPYEQIAWFPLCAALTGVGLVLSFLAFRRRGAIAGMRVTAWALLPIAAFLTGALQALWTIGSTIVGFVTSLVFNPSVWIGVAVTALSVVLFVVSGILRGRKLARADAAASPAVGDKPAAKPVQQPAGKPAVAAPKPRTNDDDFSDIEDILKKRGIS